MVRGIPMLWPIWGFRCSINQKLVNRRVDFNATILRFLVLPRFHDRYCEAWAAWLLRCGEA